MINDYKIGKVFDYNGETGYVITDDFKYPFGKNSIETEISNGDTVEFIPNLVVFGEEKTYVAKYIRKYNLENEKHKKLLSEK